MRKGLLACAVGLLAMGAAPPAEAARRALLVGVSDYADPRVSLKGPRNDVRHMKATLLDHLDYRESEIRILEDSAATRAGILKAIEDWLIAGSAPGDEIFFYFSGHGSQVEDQPGGDEQDDGLDETLVGHDLKHVLDDELGALLDRLSDRRVTVVVDACHSGTGTRSLSLVELENLEPDVKARYLPPQGGLEGKALDPVRSRGMEPLPVVAPEGLVSSGPLREAWSAASAEQLAFEARIEGEPRGVFTHALIGAIRRDPAADKNRDGRISREEALEYTRLLSEQKCKKMRGCLRSNGGSLTPQLEAEAELRALELGAWPAAAPLATPPLSSAPALSGPASSAPPALPPARLRPDAGWIAGAFPQASREGSIRPVPVSEHPAAVVGEGRQIRLEIDPKATGYLILARELPSGEVLQIFPTGLAKTSSVEFGPQDVWRVPEPNAGLVYTYDPASLYVAVIAPEQVAAQMTLWGERVLKGPEYVERLQGAFQRASASPAAVAVWRAP